MKKMIRTLSVYTLISTGLVIADAPDWSVNPPSFEFTASMTGILVFDGIQSDDTNDIVGAFVGDECRGVDDQGIFFPPSGRRRISK